ncbi:hypothetical protein V8B97DRAFT_1878130 [Scleroderma yunnanense]
MDDHALPQLPLALHARLLALPPGAYGIFYDISTQRTKDNLPTEWNTHRVQTYTQLVKHLQSHSFHCKQYSEWLSHNIVAIEVYWMMIYLKMILPLGKFETTVQNVKMHLIMIEEFDPTPDIQLGGLYSPKLEGPTPAGLVPPMIPAMIPPPGGPLPRHTLVSKEARDHNNWRISKLPGSIHNS